MNDLIHCERADTPYPVPRGVARMARWRQAAELGCKFVLIFWPILWPIVKLTPENAGFMDRQHRTEIALDFARLLCGMGGRVCVRVVSLR